MHAQVWLSVLTAVYLAPACRNAVNVSKCRIVRVDARKRTGKSTKESVTPAKLPTLKSDHAVGRRCCRDSVPTAATQVLERNWAVLLGEIQRDVSEPGYVLSPPCMLCCRRGRTIRWSQPPQSFQFVKHRSCSSSAEHKRHLSKTQVK